MNLAPPQLWKLPRARYDQMIDAGLLGRDDKVELLDGLLVAQGRQSPMHAVVVGLARAALKEAFARRYHLREEKPVALDRVSEPEPDISVVPGRPRDFLDSHPAKPVLIVEVADSSLMLDRMSKGALYARAGITEYWVVNLIDEVLEVYREPVRRRSWRYARARRLKRGAVIRPLAAPRARIRVASLLP